MWQKKMIYDTKTIFPFRYKTLCKLIIIIMIIIKIIIIIVIVDTTAAPALYISCGHTTDFLPR